MAGELLEVGAIHKPHGLKGEMVVSWTTNMVAERTAPGTRLQADDEPVVVASSRKHQDRWLMTFEGFAGRDEVDRLRGRTLFAAPIEAEDQVFVHEMVGLHLVDQHGLDHGPVTAMIDNPASDLLELADGLLVPLSFYVRHDDKQVHVDVPPGLLDDGAISAR